MATIGYTDVGGSYHYLSSLSDSVFVNKVVFPYDVLVSSMTAYISYNTFKLGIWAENGATEDYTGGYSSTTAAWRTVSFSSSVSLLAGTYYIGAICDNNGNDLSSRIYYDADAGEYDTYGTNNYSSPQSLNLTDYTGRIYSVYATYTIDDNLVTVGKIHTTSFSNVSKVNGIIRTRIETISRVE